MKFDNTINRPLTNSDITTLELFSLLDVLKSRELTLDESKTLYQLMMQYPDHAAYLEYECSGDIDGHIFHESINILTRSWRLSK